MHRNNEGKREREEEGEEKKTTIIRETPALSAYYSVKFLPRFETRTTRKRGTKVVRTSRICYLKFSALRTDYKSDGTLDKLQ